MDIYIILSCLIGIVIGLVIALIIYGPKQVKEVSINPNIFGLFDIIHQSIDKIEKKQSLYGLQCLKEIEKNDAVLYSKLSNAITKVKKDLGI
jgi:hypothetical protein